VHLHEFACRNDFLGRSLHVHSNGFRVVEVLNGDDTGPLISVEASLGQEAATELALDHQVHGDVSILQEVDHASVDW
jgi:hypothetical protein